MRTITLNEHDMGCEHSPDNRVTCGTCQRSWCDICDPTPSARCPFEYEHMGDEYTPLAPHGGCNWKGCRECFPEDTYHDAVVRDANDDDPDLSPREIWDIHNEGFLPDDEAIVNDIAREAVLRSQVNPQANGPCPVCGESDGFHDDNQHRNDIDPKYLLEKGWHQR